MFSDFTKNGRTREQRGNPFVEEAKSKWAAVAAAVVAAAASAYASSAQSDAQKKAGSAGAVAGMGGGNPNYQPTAEGLDKPDTGGSSIRQMLGFDAQRRETGMNSGPAATPPPAKGFSAGGAPPAQAPTIGAPSLPQGQSVASQYQAHPGVNNLAGGYGNDLTMPPTQQIGAQQKTDTGDAQKYAQYAQLAASLGSAFMQHPGGGAGIPHAVGGNYQPTAGQFARR